MKKVFDKTMFLYLILGLLNYAVCNAVMLFVNIALHVPETPSLILEFVLQTINSFILNRYVTFRGWRVSRLWPLISLCSIGVCYLLAKVLMRDVFVSLMQAEPLRSVAAWGQDVLKNDMPLEEFCEKIAMLLCTLTYSAINYIGQRYVVFRRVKTPETEEEA